MQQAVDEQQFFELELWDMSTGIDICSLKNVSPQIFRFSSIIFFFFLKRKITK